MPIRDSETGVPPARRRSQYAWRPPVDLTAATLAVASIENGYLVTDSAAAPVARVEAHPFRRMTDAIEIAHRIAAAPDRYLAMLVGLGVEGVWDLRDGGAGVRGNQGRVKKGSDQGRCPSPQTPQG